MSPLSQRILHELGKGRKTTRELTSLFEQPMEVVQGSLSSMKRAGLVEEESPGEWRKVTGPPKPQRDPRLALVVARGEKKRCIRCHVEKGAPGFYAADDVCRQCRNTERPTGLPGPRKVEPLMKTENSSPPVKEGAETITQGNRPAWVEETLRDLREKKAAIDRVIGGLIELYGE